MTRTAMIVMESGSDWPGQVGDSTNVVAFSHGDEDLLRRTQERLGALERRREGVRVAVLACNGATGEEAAGRRPLAKTLLGAVTIRGRLILSANGRASYQLRQELLTLAEELRGRTAVVSLLFTEAPPGSACGTRRVPKLF